jgi:hypothetical protein
VSKDDRFYGSAFADILFIAFIMVAIPVISTILSWAFNWWKSVLGA